ncbi:RNA degradosome polyphosphate kinase [Sphingorhabdus lutea]|uniref:Polyphosphate kinase n=1 Tax=Sphingorhabdus lutea TaxID=1913578 RepID=A0A1L3JCG9_9SPHN|nr:RNA degradosome polyphosphate kinase [Sphingorhabdus lutea]APG62847.1 RNA degradosome polyphosphate kinase [Sphingorhabdus lutea]
MNNKSPATGNLNQFDAEKGFVIPVGGARYSNRELSWLKFNERVLSEAENMNHPILERLRFLSISATNLDEFFMVRVAGLAVQLMQNVDVVSFDGRTPRQQLSEIEMASDALVVRQSNIWKSMREELANMNITVTSCKNLSKAHVEWLHGYFYGQIYPLLTPQALDPSHPFPFIANLGRCLLLDIEDDKARQIWQLILLPDSLARFVKLPGEEPIFVAVEHVIAHFAETIFPQYKVKDWGMFRLIRNSDIEFEEEAEDLVQYFKGAIKRRRRGDGIRLELTEQMGDKLRNFLIENVSMMPNASIDDLPFVGVCDLSEIVDLDLPIHKFSPFSPRFPERVREYDGDIFAAVKAKDILVHHPYESFDVVISFLEQAAADPKVVAIKQTLYRAGSQSRIIRALINAAEQGKSVTVVVEIKARFDEEQNLYWADALEKAGVQVVYGFVNMKTHAKISMVIRKEDEGIVTYCHFGTGNYHPITSKIYTDLSYFTANKDAASDAVQLFNYVTGYIKPHDLKLATFSPHNMREKLNSLIEREIANVEKGLPGEIWAKMNSLVDVGMIEKLYEASQKGVNISLVVRGICCLRPGVLGLSENIRVKSIVGRFLEHSRIWAFGNGAKLPHDKADVYISSADWMTRNLDRRVEYMLPMINPTVHMQILFQVLLANLLDNQQSWTLNNEGEYVRVQAVKKPFNLHQYFMDNPSLSGRGKALKKKSVPKLRQLSHDEGQDGWGI